MMAVTLGSAVAACSSDPVYEADENGEKTILAPTPDKDVLVNSLVDRFYAPACLNAKLVGTMRRTSPEGFTGVRAYTAPVACISDLIESFPDVGFSESEPGVYSGRFSDSSEERIRVEIADDRSIGGIEWEIDYND